MSTDVYKCLQMSANVAPISLFWGAISVTSRAVPRSLPWTPRGRWARTSQPFSWPPTTSSFLLARAAATHFVHPDCRPGASTRLASRLREPAQAPSQCDRIARVSLGLNKRRQPDLGLGLSRARSSLGVIESVWEGPRAFGRVNPFSFLVMCLALQAHAADFVGRLAAGNRPTQMRLWPPQHLQLLIGRN